MHDPSLEPLHAAVAAARADLASFDQVEADAIAAWALFGNALEAPAINHGRRAALVRAVADAERDLRRATLHA